MLPMASSGAGGRFHTVLDRPRRPDLRRIWESVVGLSILLNHGHLVVWKGLEFLLLRRSFGNHYVKARGNESVFYALRLGAAYCQGEQREGTEDFK